MLHGFKESIVEYLERRAIETEEGSFKTDLVALAKLILTYHCDFNAIEIIRAHATCGKKL